MGVIPISVRNNGTITNFVLTTAQHWLYLSGETVLGQCRSLQ
jgi:hypothetical protein